MLTFADCEALPAYDQIFMQDDEKVICNIVGTIFFEKWFCYISVKVNFPKYLVSGGIRKCPKKNGTPKRMQFS
jgi:hypothetical protein